jgi:hypothetical protein
MFPFLFAKKQARKIRYQFNLNGILNCVLKQTERDFLCHSLFSSSINQTRNYTPVSIFHIKRLQQSNKKNALSSFNSRSRTKEKGIIYANRKAQFVKLIQTFD